MKWRIERWSKAAQRTTSILAGEEPLELAPTGEEGVNQIRALLARGERKAAGAQLRAALKTLKSSGEST